MSIKELTALVRRGWALIATAVLVCATLGGIAHTVMPPRYDATASVFVTTQGATSAEMLQSSAFARERVKSYIGVATSPQVLERVAAQLDLDVADLEKQVTAVAAEDTVVLDITVSDTSPERAAAIANATARSLRLVVEQLETSSTTGGPSVKLSLIREARTPDGPSGFSKAVMIVLGALVGGAGAIVALILRDTFDTKIRTIKDIEHRFGGLALGTVATPMVPLPSSLVVAKELSTPMSEGYQRAWQGVRYISAAHGTTTHVVSSIDAKHDIAAAVLNLALAASSEGSSVLVVDACGAHPSLRQAPGKSTTHTLDDVLLRDTPLSDACRRLPDSTVDVLTPDYTAKSDTHRSTKGIVELAQSAESDYDVILLLAPPLIGSADAVALAAPNGHLLVVGTVGETLRTHVLDAASRLRTVGIEASGTLALSPVKKGPTKTPPAKPITKKPAQKATSSTFRSGRGQAAKSTASRTTPSTSQAKRGTRTTTSPSKSTRKQASKKSTGATKTASSKKRR